MYYCVCVWWTCMLWHEHGSDTLVRSEDNTMKPLFFLPCLHEFQGLNFDFQVSTSNFFFIHNPSHWHFFILLHFLSVSLVLFVTQEPGDSHTMRKTYRGWWCKWNIHFGTRQSRKVVWLSGIVCTEYATWVLFLAKQRIQPNNLLDQVGWRCFLQCKKL